jgi:hypothetical protein
VLLGAFLTAISPLMAQSGRVRIRVIDQTGAGLPTAEGSLLGPDSKPVRTVQANEKGEIVFMDLPTGDNRFAVYAMGFRTRHLTVTIQNDHEALIGTTLEVGSVGEFVTVKRRPWWWLIFR